MAHLLLSVCAMASNGRESFGGGGKMVFGVHGRASAGLIYRQPTPAGNIGRCAGTAGEKHWPTCPLEISGGNSGTRQNFAPGAVPPPSGRACR
jgi:hypothetical protein